MTETLEYNSWLRDFVARSEHPFIRDSEAMVEYLLQLDTKVPAEYGWRVMDRDTFKERVLEQIGNRNLVEDVNRIYWQDMARCIEASGVVMVWRGAELVRASLRLLNGGEILAPAALARSLLELAASGISNSNVIEKSVRESLAQAPDKTVIISTEIEELVVRILYGTRMAELPDYPKQTNALTYIQRVSKNPNASELISVYEFLCDLTHPNVLGNARFWAAIDSKNEDGSETLRMERCAESVTTSQIREKTLWAIGWSSACVRNSFEIGQDAVRMILQRWPR